MILCFRPVPVQYGSSRKLEVWAILLVRPVPRLLSATEAFPADIMSDGWRACRTTAESATSSNIMVACYGQDGRNAAQGTDARVRLRGNGSMPPENILPPAIFALSLQINLDK